jgi:hypothetical protein
LAEPRIHSDYDHPSPLTGSIQTSLPPYVSIFVVDRQAHEMERSYPTMQQINLKFHWSKNLAPSFVHGITSNLARPPKKTQKLELLFEQKIQEVP